MDFRGFFYVSECNLNNVDGYFKDEYFIFTLYVIG